MISNRYDKVFKDFSLIFGKIFLSKEKLSKANDWDSYLTYKLTKLQFIL